MKTKDKFKGITIALIAVAIVLFMGFKKTVNNDLSVNDSPLFSQSLSSSVAQLERKGTPSELLLDYSISGRIDSINSGKGLKGIVVVLTRLDSPKGGMATIGTPTCVGSSTCAGSSTCFGGSTCAGSSTCFGGSTCAGSSTCLGGATCAGSTTCLGGATCSGSATCIGSSTCSSTCLYTCAATCQSTCYGKTTCYGSLTCAGSSTYCGTTCPTINSTTCTGSTYCGSVCPTVNGTTCQGTTYCGNNCPTVNQVTCYTTCSSVSCTNTFVKYDTTDVNGQYSFSGLTAGTYIVTPKDSIYKLIPENRSCVVTDKDVADINFSSLFNVITSVSEFEQPHFDIVKVYPNPFSDFITITYELYEATDVTINIYGINGSLVKKSVSRQLMPGSYNFIWEPTGCESGIYAVDLLAGNSKVTKKIIYRK